MSKTEIINRLQEKFGTASFRWTDINKVAHAIEHGHNKYDTYKDRSFINGIYNKLVSGNSGDDARYLYKRASGTYEVRVD